jgi:RNA polymerase sigma-19 factor, ECF subfamily
MVAKNGYDEKELLHGLAQGNENALASIYQYFWQPLFISAYNVLKEKAACEDILQDIFLQLWVNRESLVIHSSLRAYLYTATRYQVFRYIKTGACREMLFDKLEERLAEPSSENNLQEKETSRIINSIVNNLPEKCRVIYKLSREQQLSHKEIADQLNISTKTVENQITIALRKLRSSLNRAVSLLFLF